MTYKFIYTRKTKEKRIINKALIVAHNCHPTLTNLDFYCCVVLAAVDSDDATDHLWNDDHGAKMGSHGRGFLHHAVDLLALFFFLKQLFQQCQLRRLHSLLEPNIVTVT